MYPMILNPGVSVTLIINGKPFIASASHRNYAKIIDKIKAKDMEGIEDLFSEEVLVNKWGSGKVVVQDGNVIYNGLPLDGVVVDRILSLIDEGFEVDYLVKFLDNLMLNPSSTAVKELYLFLESGNLAITPDGNFLAYKIVKENFYDIYSGTVRYAPGDEPEVPRNMVDDVRDRTCSHGLHFCSKEYLPHYGSARSGTDKIVVVEINPADVVSIPSDYNNTKGRTCKMKVIGEVSFDEAYEQDVAAKPAVKVVKRDASGRFCK